LAGPISRELAKPAWPRPTAALGPPYWTAGVPHAILLELLTEHGFGTQVLVTAC
jgi:hypothetical protein